MKVKVKSLLIVSLIMFVSSCSTHYIDNAADDAAFRRGWDRECTPAAGAKPQTCSETYWSTKARAENN